MRGGFNGRIANRKNLIFFAADLTGMAEDDQASVIQILAEIGRFPHLADRLQQAWSRWVLLARGMREQLAGLPALAKYKLQINRNELYYSGISQAVSSAARSSRSAPMSSAAISACRGATTRCSAALDRLQQLLAGLGRRLSQYARPSGGAVGDSAPCGMPPTRPPTIATSASSHTPATARTMC